MISLNLFPPHRVGFVAGQIESVIHFIDGDELEAQDTVDEIDRAIGDLRTGRVPLIPGAWAWRSGASDQRRPHQDS